MPKRKVSARLVKADFQNRIEVMIPGIASVKNIWLGNVGQCVKDFSDDELQQILRDCRTQREKLGDHSESSIFHTMISELEEAMREREISIKPFNAQEQNLLKKILGNLNSNG